MLSDLFLLGFQYEHLGGTLEGVGWGRGEERGGDMKVARERGGERGDGEGRDTKW